MILLEAVSEWNERVVIDDDGRVCYGYLFVEGRCVSDVWLYNVEEASLTPEWKLPDARDRMPFLNPKELCTEESFLPLEASSEVRIYWGELEGRLQAAIHLRGQYHALLTEGEKPGWCRLAAQDGPAAKVLKRK
jgi:hypothetical protein